MEKKFRMRSLIIPNEKQNHIDTNRLEIYTFELQKLWTVESLVGGFPVINFVFIFFFRKFVAEVNFLEILSIKW